MSHRLPDPVDRLINDHIDSVEQLEVLLLLQRTAQAWTGAEVAAELRIDPGSAQRRLENLVARGFASVEGEAFWYRRSNTVDASVRQLAEAYKDRRVSVITFIFSKPRDASLDPARALAEAFRIKKEPKDG